MRFHIFGLAHTKTNNDYTACAYTAKVLKFGKMMTQRGHTVIHYGHPDSELECTEHVNVISRETYDRVYGDHDFHSKFFRYDMNDAAYQEFYRNAIAEINIRQQKHDFLLPFWGVGHKPITDAFPNLITVEPGIGYASGHWARWKIFESYAIYHAYYGLSAVGQVRQDNYDAVIPNYFMHEDFDYQPEKSDYVLYTGRVYNGKGVHIAIEATRAAGMRLIIAGQGNLRDCGYDTQPDHVEFVGYADRETRRQLMARARCSIVASQYLEPFGGVMVENLFSGTPVITSDWGAMSENNLHGITGYRCRNFEQYVWALKNIDRIQPEVCRDYAMNNFTLEAIAPKYEEYFQQVLDVYTGSGWYQQHGIQGIDLPNRYIPPSQARIDYDLIAQEEQPQAARLAQWIRQNLNPQNLLDVGCGPGTYIDEYRQQGILAQGIEPDDRVQHEHIQAGSLLEPLAKSAELVVCLEVLEHIDPTWTELALKNLVNSVTSPGILIFTAACPGQSGVKHINTRTRDQWIKLLEAQGMILDTALTDQLRNYMQSGAHMGWFVRNLIVCRK